MQFWTAAIQHDYTIAGEDFITFSIVPFFRIIMLFYGFRLNPRRKIALQILPSQAQQFAFCCANWFSWLHSEFDPPLSLAQATREQRVIFSAQSITFSKNWNHKLNLI